MTHLLNCPVCGYKEIADNTCPNCDTDLSLIRSLTELPPSEKAGGAEEAEGAGGVKPISKVAGWQVGLALVILMLGIGLGALGSFLFLQPQLISNKVNSPSSVVINSDKTPSVKPLQPTQYTVKPKDNLTVITQKYCGNGNLWQVMVKANPQLKGRENWLNVGEVLRLPNCEG